MFGFFRVRVHNKMFFYVRIAGEKSDSTRQYVCRNCGLRITGSKSIIHVDGEYNHTRVNPLGRICSFMTVVRCENVIIDELLYLEHSWFTGYGWKFIVCCNCLLHLRWRYESIKTEMNPGNFYGILSESVGKSSDSQHFKGNQCGYKREKNFLTNSKSLKLTC